ncbi:hypothetical protein CDV36_009273 [Fusarium kuroshium]|uniref:Uncharacterized protein n=3 Tax=Fusarium solani species complex TaxID=232080 RepID=A0A3M2S193_9HYPO|nr:hypothetical protein CDV36_009273 [Fusarium kuroshium]RSL90818.1 hypothetical protein CEP52_014466 [Fusarium oligoseptatum]RSM21013.1 hypothetical protein CDV31_000060 [Fusarium ambrosium]
MGFGGSGRFIMIRKRLSGDILIGRVLSRRPHHCALLELSPLAFVFNQIPVRLVNGFGVVVRNDSGSDNVIQVTAPQSRTRPPRRAIGEILHSVAPLGGLVRVSIYQSRDSGFCAGLLMEYEDGAQRTLGSCRLGVDPVTTYSQPTHICFTSTTLTDPDMTYPVAKVEASNREKDHTHTKEWTCCPVSWGGSLEVWFSYRVFNISFHGALA